MNSVVALVKCETYDEEAVARAIEEGINLLGGIEAFVKPGERILLKPNVLVGAKPDKGVNTHPSVFKSVGRKFQGAGAQVCCGDSPAVGKPVRNMKKCQLKQAAEELGIEIVDFEEGKEVIHTEAVFNKHFVIANGVLESDGVVSLSKLKTHGLVRVTGAIKNQFGCIPGLLKSEFHLRLPDPYDFSMMLVDLTSYIKPRLYIMDAIVAMEDNGPMNGNPIKLGVLLFSTDPVALDAIACKIIDMNPAHVPTLAAGERAGLGTFVYENIEIVGEPVETFTNKEFKAERSRPDRTQGPFLRRRLKNRVAQRPVMDKSKCSRCGTCVDICPVDPKAINWSNGDKSKPPKYHYGKCLRCFCCQEICPEGAITAKYPLMGKAYLKLDKVARFVFFP